MLKPLGDVTLSEQQVAPEIGRLHAAVDDFALQMKFKLADKARAGYTGWDDPANAEHVYNLLLAHAAGARLAHKQEIDIANFAMFLWLMRAQQDVQAQKVVTA